MKAIERGLLGGDPPAYRTTITNTLSDLLMECLRLDGLLLEPELPSPSFALCSALLSPK
jgi:hypothetical protein